MKKILIDASFFNPSSGLAKGLFSSLTRLHKAGYQIIVADEKSILIPGLTDLLRLEGIEIALTGNAKADVVFSPEGGIPVQQLTDNLLHAPRTAKKIRATKETDISVTVNLDENTGADIATGIGFFDHMLEQISRHGNIGLQVSVKGDLHIDEHHTVEDTGIALGEALAAALGDKRGIKRYGFLLPMDDCVAEAAIDLGGRACLQYKVKFKREKVGDFPTELGEEFFRALSQGMKANVYIKAKGKNEHHKLESIFKAFAKALNEACRFDDRAAGALPSTKGVL
ncbi:MAG: imidazoleglycerol-phosphate dehydratase HisB [Ignavibacteriales bacterium]|nr:imidazoleglycerol-phosphate dehydratase HisB [Ignavibacteriales bacterium]